MSHLLHVFPLISLHELTPITDAYQWKAHDHFEQTIKCDFWKVGYPDIFFRKYVPLVVSKLYTKFQQLSLSKTAIFEHP